jgi:hypothetical protein
MMNMAKRRCNMRRGCSPTIPMGLMPEEETPDSIVIRQVNAEIPLAKISSYFSKNSKKKV